MKIYEVRISLDRDDQVWSTYPHEISVEEIVHHNNIVDELNEREIEASGLHGTEFIHQSMEYYLVEEPEENDVWVMCEDIYPYTDREWTVITKAYSPNRAWRNAYSFACAQI